MPEGDSKHAPEARSRRAEAERSKHEQADRSNPVARRLQVGGTLAERNKPAAVHRTREPARNTAGSLPQRRPQTVR